MILATRGVTAILVEQLHLDALANADADAAQRKAAIEFLKLLEINGYAHEVASQLRMRLEAVASC